MSLVRAFTVRRNKNADAAAAPAPYIGRAASQRSPNSKPIARSQISLPVALISTTNMLSYEAPDIFSTATVAPSERVVSSSGSSVSDASSGDESDRSSTSAHSNETAATSVDGGSSPNSPEFNHLSCYFKPNVMTSTVSSRESQATTISSSRQSFDSPQIPQRAPSHSKHAHVLSHKRSVQRIGGHSAERENSRTSLDTLSSVNQHVVPSSHPFGKELEQLSEAAEEFGSAVRDAEAEEDFNVMSSRGLGQFCAAAYMSEIAGLYSNAFQRDAALSQPMAWI